MSQEEKSVSDLSDANHELSKELTGSSRQAFEGGAERPAAMKRVCDAEDVCRMSAMDSRYRVIVENADEAIVVVQDGLVKFANRKARELFDYMEQEFAAIPFFELIHPEDRERVTGYYSSRLTGETHPSRYAYRVIGSGGIIHWIENGSVMIDWDGRPATLNFITDITDRKRMETRLLQGQKMEAIGTLAGGIAHDFNNLLMGIAGYTSLMKLDLKPSHRHYGMVERIEEQVKSGSDLTRQLLGFARGGRYDVKPIQLNDLILRLSEIFSRTRKEISLRRKFQEDLWTVAVDPGQIEQVLMNLLMNADQAMSGSGVIFLETENVDLQEEVIGDFTAKPGRYVKCSLSDTGMGMDEQTRTRIFEPFFTTRSMGKGMGLGLAVVYGIVKGHDGFVNVSSEVGHGTTFSIYLPASEKDVLPQPSPPDELVGGSERILLVDDEKDVREVGGALLEALGYGVFSASSGPEALALYLGKRQEIHLVILDMVMPGISGEETFAKLREVDPEVKVILSSGYSIDSRIRNIMERGCKGFLQKPYTMKELSRIVRSVLSKGLTPP